MELRTEKPEITAKNYLSVGPGEYPCGNNLHLIVTRRSAVFSLEGFRWLDTFKAHPDKGRA